MKTTPPLYKRINPIIQKRLLALIFLLIGFIIWMILLLLWFYGVGLFLNLQNLAISTDFPIFFIVMLCFYPLLHYDVHSYISFPYVLQKYLIDPKLRQDLEHHRYLKTTATIIAIHQQKKYWFSRKRYQLELQLHGEEPTTSWFNINLSNANYG